jgi:hypothetical protein
MSNTSTIKQTPIAAITSRQQDSDAAVRRVIESIGFPASGVYLPPSNAPYISSVTSLFSTNVILAENLHRVETSTATLTYVDQKVANLVDNAPAVLDTLRELAASLGDNPNLIGTLTSTIAVEVARATEAEGALSSLISTVVTSTINAEIDRATAVDNFLSTTLNQEVSTINGTISTVVTSSINAEIDRATAADNALSTILNQEISTINSNISTIVNSTINAEIVRATAADNALSTILNQEVSTINSNISTIVTSTINAEINRATAADNVLSTTIGVNFSTTNVLITSSITSTVQYIDKKITDVIGNAPAILDTLKELADSIGGDSNIFGTLTSSITNEITRATAAEAALSTFVSSVVTSTINSEVERATAADAVLTTVNTQSYFDLLENQSYRVKYVGPCSPTDISSNADLAWDSPNMRGALILIQPTITNFILYLPNYTRTWHRAGTLDLTNKTTTAPLDLSTLVTAYNNIQTAKGSAIVYYDIYISPYKVFSSSANYGYLKNDAAGSTFQAHAGYILVRDKATLYSEKTAEDADSVIASPLGPTDGTGWFLIHKESIAEIERKFIIANVNTPDDVATVTTGVVARTLYIRVPNSSASFEIAPAETANLIYTNAGWIMTNSY